MLTNNGQSSVTVNLESVEEAIFDLGTNIKHFALYNSEGFISCYHWSYLPIRSMSAGQTQSWIFNKTGSYITVLKVRDNNGLENTKSQTISKSAS